MSGLPREILTDIHHRIRLDIYPEGPIGGGDINEAYLLSHADGKLFLKYHPGDYLDMFEAEANGLRAMASLTQLEVPEVIGTGATSNYAYLLLTYIPVGHPNPSFWKNLGKGLALLHQKTAKHFGWERNNYIGRLPQHNKKENSWQDFYWQQRIYPQLMMAQTSGYFNASQIGHYEGLYQNIPSICPKEEPAFLHGDLWSGNFMTNQNGNPVLIDPAIAYGHREMDLAMTRLFGGFSHEFYEAYHQEFPLEKGWEARMDFYQLYYLLVHLNLFGSGYLERCRSILEKYS